MRAPTLNRGSAQIDAQLEVLSGQLDDLFLRCLTLNRTGLNPNHTS